MTKYNGIIYEAYWDKDITPKVYIGQTSKTLNKRIMDHEYSTFTLNFKYKFYKAIRKYGMPNFRVIDEYHSDDKDVFRDAIDSLESYYISNRDSFKNGYNSTLGGITGGKTSKYSEIYCKELWELNKSGKSCTEIGVIKSIDRSVVSMLIKRLGVIPLIHSTGRFKKGVNVGIPRSEEVKRKISKANKGRKHLKKSII